MKNSLQIFSICAALFLASCKSGSEPAKENSENNTASSSAQSKENAEPGSNNQQNIPADVVQNPNSAEGKNNEVLEKAAVIDFETREKNFGTINEGQSISMYFKFKNKGLTPLVITNARAGCGCTSPEYPKDPIPSGREGVIKVTFNSEGKGGDNEKFVEIESNATEPVIKLIFRGHVNPKKY